MLEAKRKSEIVRKLYRGFNYYKEDEKLKIEEDWYISSKSISFIFRGGDYALSEVEEVILSHTNNHKEEEKYFIKIMEYPVRHRKTRKTIDYYINLPFLISIIKDVNDDPDELEAFYCYVKRNSDIFDITVPNEEEISSIFSIA